PPHTSSTVEPSPALPSRGPRLPLPPRPQVTRAASSAPQPINVAPVTGFTKPILLTKRVHLRSGWRNIPRKWLAAGGAVALLAAGVGYWAVRKKPAEPPQLTGPPALSSELKEDANRPPVEN